jgi:GTP diphosphokinase / guanosine-3',5'-bis(diphosphate) 3'-diphosphatase
VQERGSKQLKPAQLLKAIAFAADKHRRQRRKDAEASPYINHPIAVVTALAVEGEVSDEVTLLAAALHDTVEDTQTTFGELEEHFGPEVAGLVRELTDDKSRDKMERKRLQIEHAAQSSSRAKQLKIADKICNIRDITVRPPADWAPERRSEYLRWSERVVAGCRNVNAKLDQAFDQAITQAREVLKLNSEIMSMLEIVLKVGGEGGDLTLYGSRTTSGWQFNLIAYDWTPLLEDEGDPAIRHTSSRVTSWAGAVALLDTYPQWAEFDPLAVHPDFREQVWKEVQSRLHHIERHQQYLDRWRRLCESSL